ncbi:hypothetical protein R3P38DRAFT_3449523 [Favolaschia claudopus]|uniref:Uncharacterized protein n=1 Tax=Favolaschia claudopus TaxID=2862362 RepID=A0AAW0CWG6_9AGAR
MPHDKYTEPGSVSTIYIPGSLCEKKLRFPGAELFRSKWQASPSNQTQETFRRSEARKMIVGGGGQKKEWALEPEAYAERYTGIDGGATVAFEASDSTESPVDAARALHETTTECKDVKRRAGDEGHCSCAEGDSSLRESSTSTGRWGPVPSPVNSHPHSPTIRLLPVPPKTRGNLLPRASQHADGGRRVRQGWYYSRAPPLPMRTKKIRRVEGTKRASGPSKSIHPARASCTYAHLDSDQLPVRSSPRQPPLRSDEYFTRPPSSSRIVAVLLPPETHDPRPPRNDTHKTLIRRHGISLISPVTVLLLSSPTVATNLLPSSHSLPPPPQSLLPRPPSAGRVTARDDDSKRESRHPSSQRGIWAWYAPKAVDVGEAKRSTQRFAYTAPDLSPCLRDFRIPAVSRLTAVSRVLRPTFRSPRPPPPDLPLDHPSSSLDPIKVVLHEATSMRGRRQCHGEREARE